MSVVIQRFQQKPVEVEVVQVPQDDPALPLGEGGRDFEAWGELAFWLGQHGAQFEITNDLGVAIVTSVGVQRAAPGARIVRSPNGDFHVCAEDVFAEQFEEVR